MSEPRTNIEIWRDALDLLQEREFSYGYNHDRAQSYTTCDACGATSYVNDEPPAHKPRCRMDTTLRELAAFVAAEERIEEARERSKAGVLK